MKTKEQVKDLQTTTLNCKQAFRHSYSKEFGWVVNEQKKERYVIVYNLFVGDKSYNTAGLRIEYHSSDGRYSLWSTCDFMDKFLPNILFFKTKKEAVEKANLIYNQSEKLNNEPIMFL